MAEKKKDRKRAFSTRLFTWFFLFSLLVCIAPGKGALAEQPVVSAVKGVYVYDDAEILNDQQEKSLSERLEKRGREAGCGIYVVTSSEPGHRTGDRYLEDFYDNGYDTGQIDTEAVLLFIDMKNRYVNVQAYGETQKKITDEIGDKIIDAIFGDLQNRDYYGAAMTFADRAEYYMNYVPIYLRTWVQLLAAMVIGGIVVGSMAAHNSGSMTVNAGTYLDDRYSGVRARRDDYIRTSVTKRRKVQESGGTRSGGGGGHVSSGGHSHSSSGRHF